MVDLVKIRRKARKAKEDSGADPAAHDIAIGSERGIDEPDPAAQSVAAPAETGRPAAPGTIPTASEVSGLLIAAGSAPSTKLARFKEEAGKRHDTVVAAISEEADERLEVLTFMLANEQYAVEIERIVEIVSPRPVTRVPNADATIVGIVSLRGTMVTLLNVRHKLHHDGTVAAGDPRIIVVNHGGETIGFEVDRVLRVVKVEMGTVSPHPVVHASELDQSVRGVFRQGTSLTILLDLNKLLQVA